MTKMETLHNILAINNFTHHNKAEVMEQSRYINGVLYEVVIILVTNVAMLGAGLDRMGKSGM